MRVINLLVISVFIAVLLVSLAPAKPPQGAKYDAIAKAFLEAIESEDFKKLQALIPPPAVYRQLSPRETKQRSDREIAKALENSIIPKLRKDFDNIIKGAHERRIALTKLEFVEAKLPSAKLPNASMVGVEVVYSYEGKTGHFAIVVAEAKGKIYLLEILLSYDVFRNLGE